MLVQLTQVEKLQWSTIWGADTVMVRPGCLSSNALFDRQLQG